ncbi:hypothetical protein Hanom_Chr02g00176091 [Helianthus anomalus]
MRLLGFPRGQRWSVDVLVTMRQNLFRHSITLERSHGFKLGHVLSCEFNRKGSKVLVQVRDLGCTGDWTYIIPLV